MSLEVKCSTCGHLNPLGRLFCVKCGGRLDVRPENMQRAGGDLAFWGRRLLLLVRMTVSLALLAALALLVYPVEPAGQPGGLLEAQGLAQKLHLLQVAALERRALEQEATERELNGYLAQILRNTPNRKAGGPLPFEMESIRVDLQPGEIVTVLVTKLSWITLTYELRSAPSRRDGRFALDLLGLRMGHVPLPGALGGHVAGRLANIFSRLEREKRLLDQLSTISVEDGVVRAATPGA
jgi:hypothetical protein